jgi:hypothetical protein
MRLLPLLLCTAGFVLAQDQTLVRSIRFEHFKKVSTVEILDRLKEREVALTVESPYRPEEAERAKTYIAQLLAEKGQPNARIELATRSVRPHRVEVRFTLLK